MTDELTPLPLEGDLVPPSTPPLFEQHKHHDLRRLTHFHLPELAPEARAHMVMALRGNVVWLSPESFHKILLPKPPSCVMLSSKQLEVLTTKLEEMHNDRGYIKRGQQALPYRLPEDQLAHEFTEIINDYVLDVVKGKPTGPKTKSKRSSSKSVRNAVGKSRGKVSKAAGNPPLSSAPEASQSSSTTPLPYYPVSLVSIVPDYVMRLSPYKYDISDEGRNKADAAIFRNDIAGRLQEGRPNWAYQRLFGEFKVPGTENDPFDDKELQDTEPGAITREKVRGQLVGYAERVFAYQHRTAVYSYIVFGQEFRFMRWDRSGVFVTQKVDYVKDTRTFVELLLGFIILDDASQGIDTTVTLLEEGSEAFNLMNALATGDPKVLKMPVLSYREGGVLPEHIPLETFQVPTAPPPIHSPECSLGSVHDSSLEEHGAASSSAGSPVPPATTTVRRPKERSFVFEYTLDYFVKSLEQDWPRYRIPIGTDTFLVGRPIFETTGLTGRGTRGYIAWHEQSESFVFLKDAWRPFYQGVEMEGDILKELNDAGVQHVPTLLCHGQVASQKTLVSDYAHYVDTKTNAERKAESRSTKPKGKKRQREDVADRHHIRHYAHHRLATKEVCLPLVAFKSSKQLVSLVCDCVDGHADAAEKCQRLHRDISCGNILILPTFEERPGDSHLRLVWRGVLCDWELSKPISPTKKDEKARQPERTGTWRYMSVASLKDMLHVVVIADEIESFFNVILYNALRYLPHNAEKIVSTFISDYFTKADKLEDGTPTVGPIKEQVIVDNGYIKVRTARGRADLSFRSHTVKNQGLNSLVGILLKWFKARYEVLEYENDESNAEPAEGTPDAEPSPRVAQRPRLESDAPPASTEEDEFQPLDTSDGPTLPSKDTYAKAAQLQTHEHFKRLLRLALSKWTWPDDEVKRDNLDRPRNGSDGSRSPLDGLSFEISIPSPAVSFDSNGAPRAPAPIGEKIRLRYLLGSAQDPKLKRGSANRSRSNTGSRSLQLAWDRSGTT